MRAPTLFLGFTLVVLAAVLAGLWQAYGPHTASHPKTVAVSSDPAAPSKRTLPAPPPVSQPEPNPPDESVRSVYPGGRPSAGRPPQPETSPPAPIVPPAPELGPEPDEAPVPTPPPVQTRSAASSPPAAPRPADLAPSDAAAGDAAVDLNSASVEALNELGAGKIAKTIIANRPYTAPDDLVTRRVLKRKDYDAIRSRIVVR